MRGVTGNISNVPRSREVAFLVVRDVSKAMVHVPSRDTSLEKNMLAARVFFAATSDRV